MTDWQDGITGRKCETAQLRIHAQLVGSQRRHALGVG